MPSTFLVKRFSPPPKEVVNQSVAYGEEFIPEHGLAGDK